MFTEDPKRSKLIILRSLFYSHNHLHIQTEIDGLKNNECSKEIEDFKNFYIYMNLIDRGKPISIEQIKFHDPNLSPFIEHFLNISEVHEGIMKFSELKTSLQHLLYSYYHMKRKNVKKSLHALEGCEFLDHKILKIQILMSINRFDLAEDVLKQMKAIDDSDVCTVFASCWLALHSADTKRLKQSLEELNDFQEAFGYCAYISNLTAIVKSLLEDYRAAAADIKEAQVLITKSDMQSTVIPSEEKGEIEKGDQKMLSNLRSNLEAISFQLSARNYFLGGTKEKEGENVDLERKNDLRKRFQSGVQIRN